MDLLEKTFTTFTKGSMHIYVAPCGFNACGHCVMLKGGQSFVVHALLFKERKKKVDYKTPQSPKH